MRPYFSVGEEVILFSKLQPESNGEYVVERIILPGEIIVCRLTGIEIQDSGEETFGYIFDNPIMDTDCVYGVEVVWAQESLRKKHKPADQSFSDLIKPTREIKV